MLKVGGCERYELETISKYAQKGYDIDFFYTECKNNEWLKLIAKYIGKDHIHQYKGEIIHCNTLFINYDMEGFIENVFADEVINVQHANFLLEKYYQLHTNEKITKRIAVSKENAKAFEKRFGLKCDVCYNPITITESDKRRVLNLISATRLTKEKGKQRMIYLMNELNIRNIPYIWHIWTNEKDDIKNPNVMYHEPNLDIRPYIKNADYLIQLSNSEGYSYSILEALCLGTPVITTDLPIFKEMGVVNGKNGFILPLDMSHIPIDEIYEKNLKGFKYTPKKDDYEKYLYKGKTEILEEKLMKVKMIKEVHDTVAKVHYVRPENIRNDKASDGEDIKPVGTIVDMEKSRADVIVKNGYGIYVDDPMAKIKKPRASKTNLKKVK